MMTKVKVEKLSVEAFEPFGQFFPMTDPGAKIDVAEGETWFPDRMVHNFDVTGSITYSCLKMLRRPLTVDMTENHFGTAEGFVPLDGDVITFVGSASVEPDYTKFRVFYVPKGTMVIYGRGVWHFGAFPVDQDVVHGIVSLPAMTYARDCRMFTPKPGEGVTAEV